jgi:HK97 gp10 family phage protein
MPLKSRMDTKGFEEYLEKVQKSGQDIDVVADEALLAFALIMRGGMQRRAPFLTGYLMGHINILGPDRDGNFHFVKIGVFDVNRDKEMYFFYQEMGSAHAPAQPYIRPAWAEDMRAAKAEMRNVMKERAGLE